MKSIARKREEILKDLRRKSREQIRNSIRESILAKVNSVECPLISNVFEDFLDFTHWELCQQSEKLCEIIETAVLSQLSDEQHDKFITDLYYLINQNIITIPYETKFKKNQSGYTATLVALAANSIEDSELAYWVDYMDDQAKDLMFYGIIVEDDTHQRWVTHQTLYQFLLNSMKFIESAAYTFKDILDMSMEISKKQIDQCVPFVQSAIKAQINSQNDNHRRILAGIWIRIIQIYSKLQFHNDKVKQMIIVLKKFIDRNVLFLLRSDIMQDLNGLYEVIREDFIEDDNGCQKILLEYIQNYEKLFNSHQSQLEYQQLFQNYLFRLFLNNWRAKQLYNRNFSYSSNFYQMLRRVNKEEQTNPYFFKLINTEQKNSK